MEADALSMLGRVILVRSVLSSIPVYLLSYTMMPMVGLRCMERVQEFPVGATGGRSGVDLLAWETICRPTRSGGLGIHSLIERREVLVTRVAAIFLLEPSSF